MEINMPMHLGARYGGMSSYDRAEIKTLAEAEAKARADGEIKTPHELADFRRGWYVGVVNDNVHSLSRLCKYLNREHIEAMGKDLIVLEAKYKAILYEGVET